ncbi:dihydropteroate synthase [Hwanghaeella grinnelliae]|uniref:Dihydropteroate synthase n=1 Tax=Hwanghaeella grinnelliae TaxID=2500179 RepID=A0A3S2Y0M9_9PROT|nr:dihydropteroate synthase [Hwanghaeella grinnelliae]RVU34164.1 dihydropteroate synthase [Hwanghaeella grinnelliae]
MPETKHRELPATPWMNRCAVMGIVNVTPDSFSSDGLAGSAQASSDRGLVDRAVAQAADFIEHGAEILDIGGESTRPGAAPVPADEELDRVVPVVEAIAKRFPATLISVDTYKAAVARAALDGGAHIINDVWAGRADEDMLPLMAESGVPVVLMHNKARWGVATQDAKLGGSYDAPLYGDFMQDILHEMQAMAKTAEDAGVPRDLIILDPGVGFGKTLDQNLTLIRDLGAIRKLGYPVLLGPSRKSFIGKVLDVEPGGRLMGTAASVSVGVAQGADIVRVHDVRAMTEVVRMTEAILSSGQEA